MDSSFDFDSLNPVTLEQTLAYLKAPAEQEPVETFTSYQSMLDDSLTGASWLDEAQQLQDVGMDLSEESR